MKHVQGLSRDYLEMLADSHTHVVHAPKVQEIWLSKRIAKLNLSGMTTILVREVGEAIGYCWFHVKANPPWAEQVF